MDKFNPFKNMGISLKITLWYGLFIGLILVCFTFISSEMTKYMVKASYEKELIQMVREMAEEPEEFETFDDGIYFTLLENDEVLEGRYPHRFEGKFPKSPNHATMVTLNGGAFLYFDARTPYSDGKIWVRGVVSVTNAMHNVVRLTSVFAWLSPVILILLSIGGYILIRYTLNAIGRISKTANEISNSKNFSARLYVSDVKDELHDLSLTLNEMLSSLELSYQSEKEFSNNVSHELRTPIAIILGESEYGIKYLSENKEALESFEVIQSQAKGMSDIISGLLELSRIENSQDIEKAPFNLSVTTQQLINNYKELLKDSSMKIESQIEGDLVCVGNTVLFKQLLDNLMSNAGKFTKNIIEVNLVKEESSIILSVRDDGPGIPKEKQPFIWNKFYQINDSRNKEENKGIGLGLAFTKKIADIHNWSLALESNENKGTEFKLTIPL